MMNLAFRIAGIAPPWPRIPGPRQLAFAEAIDVEGTASTTKFKKGDRVVYRGNGVMEVIDIRSEVNAAGSPELRYVLRQGATGITVKVPVATAEGSGLRRLMSIRETKKVFSTLRARPEGYRSAWQSWISMTKTKIDTGSPIAIAEALRDLDHDARAPWRTNKMTSPYQLAPRDKAMNLLVAELALVLGKSEAAVRADIQRALGQ